MTASNGTTDQKCNDRPFEVMLEDYIKRDQSFHHVKTFPADPALPTRNQDVSQPHVPSVAASVVLGKSDTLPAETPTCRGHDFNLCNNLDDIFQSFATMGFQATNLYEAVQQIKAMRTWRLSDTDIGLDDPALQSPEVRSKIRARIFLGYTSNQISCGQREVIRFLVQHKMVDVVVTTAGGIEEDIIKCFRPTYMGDFRLPGKDLRARGINRIGNLLVPNNSYCEFEDWVSPILNRMHDEQDVQLKVWAKEALKERNGSGAGLPPRFSWTPSKVIERLGKEINHEDSVLYWAAKNNIPIFCPALTDGSIGDMLYFHSYKRPGFCLDIANDIRRMNDLAIHSHASGMILLGGGLSKHHICNANLMRNGADFSVFVNTGQEFDGSDSGAPPDEAISWGKIRSTAKPVKVCGDASVIFPLIVSQTFAKNVEQWKKDTAGCVCWVSDLETFSL